MLRLIFSFVLLLHGLIHFLGFSKAFRLTEANQLTQSISKPIGVLWGISALLMVITAVLFFHKNEQWWVWGILSALFSQALIIGAWQDAKYGTIVNILALVIAIISFSTQRYYQQYRNMVDNDLQRTARLPVEILKSEDLQHLPPVVQKYLDYECVVGKPKVKSFKVEFEGKIRKNEQSEWMPFTSEQYNFMDVPTRLFFMKATMNGLSVAGFHAFNNGDAKMDIRLLSLLKVQYQTGKEMGIAETVTFFNDMCCLAPATLIDPRIKWLEYDEHMASAQFTNNGITIKAKLFFNDAGQLINFISNDRYAAGEGGTMQQLPWSTPLKDYKVINGHRIAGYADAVYSYSSGDLTYGVFKTTNIEYNCHNPVQISKP